VSDRVGVLKIKIIRGCPSEDRITGEKCQSFKPTETQNYNKYDYNLGLNLMKGTLHKLKDLRGMLKVTQPKNFMRINTLNAKR
jgi:hypothetical protein